jgi:hypothetical protein
MGTTSTLLEMASPSFYFPKSIPMGGHRIGIKWRTENPEGLFGSYHADKKLITMFLGRNEEEETAWSTLYHEMLHASLDIGGLTHILGNEEEAIVRNFDNIMLPALEKLFTL